MKEKPFGIYEVILNLLKNQSIYTFLLCWLLNQKGLVYEKTIAIVSYFDYVDICFTL